MTSMIYCLFDVVHLNDPIICLFELVYLNDLLFNEQVDNVVKEVNIKKALKSSIFVVQKAAAPKIGVEFCPGSIGTNRSSLATSSDVARRHYSCDQKIDHAQTDNNVHRAPADLKIWVEKPSFQLFLTPTKI